MLLIVMIIE